LTLLLMFAMVDTDAHTGYNLLGYFVALDPARTADARFRQSLGGAHATHFG
jgi:hypothetical protein